jgi:hypothetical protein
LPGNAGIKLPSAGRRRRDAGKIQNGFWNWPLAVGVLGTVAAALWVGFQDLVWPVSLSSQILGICFVVAGLFGLVSAALLIVNAPPFQENRETCGNRLAFIVGGAVAALYVDLTIVAYSFRYQAGKAWLFSALAVDCAALTAWTLPAAWGSVTKGVRNAGITLAALGVAANFWFQSFYLPENAQVGVEYGLSAGPVVTLGSDRFVTIDLTIHNNSSATALIVGSMAVVSGLDYLESRNPKAISRHRAQELARAYAASLTGRPPGKSAAVPNPNVRFSGKLESEALTILQPINSDSYLFPDDTYSRDFDVVIPDRRIVALDVKLFAQFTRTTRLVLGSHISSTMKRYRSCANDKQSGWSIKESALLRFTRGSQHLYSYWCADLYKPFISWRVFSAGGTHDSARAERALGSTFDVYSSSRDEIIVLH